MTRFVHLKNRHLNRTVSSAVFGRSLAGSAKHVIVFSSSLGDEVKTSLGTSSLNFHESRRGQNVGNSSSFTQVTCARLKPDRRTPNARQFNKEVETVKRKCQTGLPSVDLYRARIASLMYGGSRMKKYTRPPMVPAAQITVPITEMTFRSMRSLRGLVVESGQPQSSHGGTFK